MGLVRPLPGIRFETAAPPAGDVLPRMDIPAFVGFAASGPLHLPVAVEDPVQFATLFGANLPLVQEADTGVPVEAYLAPTVRAFFRNGGRRCWIVRVARVAQDDPLDPVRGATANRFRIPELQRIAGDGSIADAFGVARSAGSWSDGLRVRTNLVSRPLRFFALASSTLSLLVSSAREVSPGDLLRLTWQGVGPVLFVAVKTVSQLALSPPRPGYVCLSVTGDRVWVAAPQTSPPSAETRRTRWVSAPPPDAAALATAPVVEALTFDLSVSTPDQQTARMNGLGFAPEHPRYWATLPTDARLFDPDAVPTALWSEAATPRSRFPLAAETGGLYLPTSADTLFSTEIQAETPDGTALERDGLVPFKDRPFIDFDLRDATVRDLLGRADFIRYQSPEPRPLRGLHAALGIEEVTLVAVPDAVHRGWTPGDTDEITSPLASSPLAHPEWWRWLDCNTAKAASKPPAPGTPLGGGGFIDCDVDLEIAAPRLAATEPANGKYDLSWNSVPGATYVLQEATRPDFSDAADIPSGSTGGVTLHARAAGILFYRVRRVQGARTSDWSNGVGVRIAAAAGWTSISAGDYNDSTLKAVHQALLTMCAARGDLVAVLSLPSHYDERQAVAHPERLDLDSRTRSYGALWHPWLVVSDGDPGALKATPPDGATAGVIAARALSRGAWIAPANEPLTGPVALTPPLSAAFWQPLQDAAVNVIRQEPWGFVCLDADTLSLDDEVRPLNVRRLIALVRRAALRVGEAYVFEPNGGAAQRAVRRAFESMLETLYIRGAFAGRTEQTSFQVVTGESLNTPQSVDAGRLIAEIRIAPSRPLSFLTIRLVAAGDGTVVQEAGT